MAFSEKSNFLLHEAVRENCTELVVKLLNEGVGVNSRDKNNNTSLHIAAENNNIIIAKILLQFGANLNAKDKYGRTTLDTAFWNGNEQFILVLLRTISDLNISTNNRNDTPLHLAAQLCSPELVNYILGRGAHVNAKKYRGKTPLHLAAKRGNAGIIASLLRYGADYNCKDEEGDTALLISSRYGKGEAVYELLKYDVDVNVQVRRGETPLHLLIENKTNTKIIELLLNKKAKLDIGSIINRTPLHICAIYGQSDTAELLLRFGANPNLQDTNNQTALHLACTQGNLEVVKILIQYSADFRIKNELGKTPLHCAVMFGCPKVVEFLLLQGAEPNVRNIDGRTPLAYSVCETYNSEIVHLLLKYGADINCKDNYGLTPLHIASRVAGKEMVSLLLNLGANINAMDYENRTALSIAMSYYDNCARTLIVLKKHIIMKQIADLHICEENLNLIESNEELNEFEDACREELDEMMRTKIGQSTISYHDFLKKSINELVKILKNADIEEELTKETNYALKFPLYGDMISLSIKKDIKQALIRKTLLEKGLEKLHDVFSDSRKLPQHCLDMIFMYLSDQDIKNWLKTYTK